MEHDFFFIFLGKLSITLENKYPSDPYKNQDTRPAYGNYFPLDRDLQKRRLEILWCLLVAALLNCSPREDNKVAALNSPGRAIRNPPLCLGATAGAGIHLSTQGKCGVSSILKAQGMLNIRSLIGSFCCKKLPPGQVSPGAGPEL